MLALIIMGVCALLACLATAGLIASSQTVEQRETSLQTTTEAA